MARILVVEDSEPVRAAVSVVLTAAGHQVEESVDGLRGLQMLQGEEFDLVVADIWMPGLDGIETLKQIKAGRPELPVIIISGGGPSASLEHAATRAEVHGADAVLFKPFEESELLDAVGACLGKRRD